MSWTRRDFLQRAGLLAAAFVGPWSLKGRKGHAATVDTPALEFLTPSEYRFIRKLSFEVIPDEPVLSGQVDVAKNLDQFFAHANYNPDFLILFRFLRLIKLASPLQSVIGRLSPGTIKDITDFKRTILFMGYYSDLNGEADLPPEKRIVWPRIGYGGPKPEGWFPPDEEERVDETLLVDRIKEAGL